MILPFVRSLSSKVFFVLLVFIVSLSAVYGVLNTRLVTIDETLNDTLTVSKRSVSILKINKEIVELQRDISVFSASGSRAIFDKIKDNYLRIKSRLIDVRSSTQRPDELNIINAMLTIVERYGQNLEVLIPRYEARGILLEEKLPAIALLAEQQFRTKLHGGITTNEKLVVYELLDLWQGLARNANLYLTKKDYQKKALVIDGLKRIEQLLELAKKQNIFEDEKLHQLSINFNKAFNESIQANRNYLTLVNVVMAGDAVEFSTLADKLRADSLDRLDEIRVNAEKSVTQSEKMIQLSMLIGGGCLCIFVLFFHFHIIRSIRQLTESFQYFIQGDLSKPIRELNRKDEIGMLASAANQFKVLSGELVDAKLEAEQTSKIKSDFLANMSHEIRTPMNGILGMVRQLQKTKLNSTQSKMLDVIGSSGKSLLVIINDILDISKLEAGKMELDSHPFDINKLVYELEQICRPLVKSTNVQFVIDNRLPQHARFVQGDEVRLKQVLLNLLSNAIKFTSEGGVTLRLTLTKELNASQVMNFSITDTGIGIPQDRIAKLFEAFSQADTSITRRFGGTGLGLTISSKLLGLMGARLQVSSIVGQGSTFEFSLILARCSRSDVEKLNSFKKKGAEILFATQGSILLVEDNKVNQIVAISMLKDIGFTKVTIAENGKEAVQLCQEAEFELILMDMQMPEMDGPTATQYIRQLPHFTDTPVIALTANVLEQDKRRCMDVGMTHFVSKPIDYNDFVNALNEVLPHKRNEKAQ
ncbi:response regulator [Pseudoalteromonas sp. L23]|uniref:hybrid sensor histidine kinase/response regulator n=1 Tax=unclassified Pseudoalteromonas TaxID=194690 RepID=UPI001EF033CC|nr:MULTISPECIES: ATP-binding protein [unclassified Pseudoalteromonas]MCF7516510.1 response regulator [Pseudoalteromonas sp. L7]MCF7528548.1 response regulator [Pseudoalteromonas sp. L23]